MSNLSFLEKLLGGVEVEWPQLGNVIKLEKGRQLNKELLTEEGLYPAYNGGVSHSGFTDLFNYTENKTIVSQGGASAGFVNFVTSKFYANAHCYVVLPNAEAVVNRYVYHFLKLNQIRLTGKQHGAGIPALRTSEILDIPIPIPCPGNPKKSLEIQAEIVRILDTFTELATELTTELNSRKKQYNYYREQLMSFEDGEVEWKTLGTIATFSQGIQVDVSNQFPESQENFVRFLRIVDFVKDDEIPRYIKNPGQKYLKEDGELIMIRYGASAAGKVFLNHRGAIANNMFKINLITDLITTKFLYAYLSQPSIYNNLNSNGGTSTMPAITFGQIGAVNIPIPPLDEQARIVTILDKFDALTNSISEGLPREIELRQKQYEYYRDLLLSFPKPDAEVVA